MSVELVHPNDANLVAGVLRLETVLDVQVRSVVWDRSDAVIDEWGRQSFPASDPPSNW